MALALAVSSLTASGTVLYDTGFETTDTPAFTAGVGTTSSPKLVGTDNWTMTVGASSGSVTLSSCYPFAGIDSGLVAGMGQTAALGFLGSTAPPSNTQFIRVGRKVDSPEPVVANGNAIIDFYCQIGLTQSTNGHHDDLELLVYNWDDKVLGGLTFDLTQNELFRYDANEYSVGYVDGTSPSPYTDTGLALSSLYGKVMEVSLRVNYNTNTWSATVNGTQVVNNATFTKRPTSSAAHTFGSMQARWYITTPGSVGSEWLLFDDWIISSYVEPTIPASASAAYAANSTASIVVTDATSAGWTISSDQTWAVASPVSGTGTTTVTVTCAANPNTTARTANITAGSHTCVLTQAAAPVTTSIPSTASAGYAANSTTSIAVTSNGSWTASSDQTWAVPSPTSGSGNGTVTVTCAANPNTTTRAATITIGGQTCVLTQAAAPASTSIPATATADYPANSTASITVTSNTGWTASSNQTWAVPSPTSGSGNGTVTVTCAANPNTTTRTATITIGGQTCVLTQNAAPASASILPTTATVGYAANSTASITVTSNMGWTASSNQTWAVPSPASGSGNATVTVTCAANTTATTRTATITVATQTCLLTQAASPYAVWAQNLTASARDFMMDADCDGVTNGMEYALGRNAASPSGADGICQLPVIAASGSGAARHLTMTLSLPEPAPADIIYDVQVSNNLTSWTGIMEKNGTGAWSVLNNSGATVSSNTESTGRTSFVIADVQGRRFMRLSITSTSTDASTTSISASASSLYTTNSTATIQVTSTAAWAASSDQSWAVVSPSSGSGNATVTVTCAGNTGLARTATITIGGQTCVLTQNAAPFALWAATLPAGQQGFYQDADGDSVINGLEYALGRAATSATGDNGTAQLPAFTWTGSGSSRRPALAVNLPATAPVDVTYTVMASNSLTGSWTAIMEKTGNNPWTVIGSSGATVTSATAGTGRILHTVTDAQSHHFLQLRITKTP